MNPDNGPYEFAVKSLKYFFLIQQNHWNEINEYQNVAIKIEPS